MMSPSNPKRIKILVITMSYIQKNPFYSVVYNIRANCTIKLNNIIYYTI